MRQSFWISYWDVVQHAALVCFNGSHEMYNWNGENDEGNGSDENDEMSAVATNKINYKL